MNKTLKLVFIIVTVAITAWLFVASPFASENPEPEVSPSISASSEDIVLPVKVGVAKKADLVKRLQTSGIIRAKSEVDLITRIPGEIVSLSAYNGKYVEKGDLLVKLDDREYQVAFEKARAALLSAQIEYKSLSSAEVATIDSAQIQQYIAASKLKFEKAEEQLQRGELSEEEYARAKRDYDADMAYYGSKRGDLVANKSGLTQAQETFERAILNLEWTEIRAPFAGYIANCNLNERMQLQVGKPLLKLVDVSSLLVDVDVLENEIGSIAVGREAEVTVNAFPEQRFFGKILNINPIVDPTSKTVKVTVELKDGRPVNRANAVFLRPGMYATVKLVTEILKDRLLVPKEALLARDQRTLVFVAKDGLAKWHYVDVGGDNEQLLEIKSGISPGDTVIIAGHYTLAHDAKIRIENR